MKASFHIGFNLLSAIMLVAICGTGDARGVRLAPDSCRPALTARAGRLHGRCCLHNRAALAEMSRVAVEDRFPLCVIDTIKASDVQIEVSFTPIAGKIDQAAGLMFRVKAILTHRG